MTLFSVVLVVATFLCSLIAGFLFAFAVVVMPGIRNLDDRDFIRAFQVIDRVIQNNQPVFVFVWVGSVLALAAAAGLGIWGLRGTDRLLVIAAALVYFLGVQWPTVSINIPLNKAIQRLDPATMDDAARARAEPLRAPLEPMERNQDGVLGLGVHVVAACRLPNVNQCTNPDAILWITDCGAPVSSVRGLHR
jgi:uncharacterized membrane protein